MADLLHALMTAGLDPLDAQQIVNAVDNRRGLPGQADAILQDARRAWWSAAHIPQAYKRLLDASYATDPAVLPPDPSVLKKDWAQQLERFAKAGMLTSPLTRLALRRHIVLADTAAPPLDNMAQLIKAHNVYQDQAPDGVPVALTTLYLDRLLSEAFKGGAGSGNFGHAGRPGEQGGSAPAGLSQAKTIADLEDWAKQHVCESADLSGCDLDTGKEVLSALANMKAMTGYQFNQIRAVDGGPVAVTRRIGQILSPGTLKPVAVQDREYELVLNREFFAKPPDALKRYLEGVCGKNYCYNMTARGVALHEFGHLARFKDDGVRALTINTMFEKWRPKTAKKKISRYAESSAAEMVPEAWVIYATEGKAGLQGTKVEALGEMFDKWVKR